MKLGRIVIDCPEYFREELAWATAHENPEVLDEFMECLSYLLQFSSDPTSEVRLRKDFAPHSFMASVMKRKIVERPNMASGDWWWVENITMGMIWSDTMHDGKHWSFHS